MSLKQLERRLGISLPKPEAGGDPSAYFAATNQAMLGEIAKAKKCQEDAEAETARLRGEVAALKGEIHAKAEAAMGKMQDMYKAHLKEMQQLQGAFSALQRETVGSIAKLQKELSSECAARVKMEAQLSGVSDMHSQLDRIVSNFKIALPAPVVNNVAPAAAPAKGAKGEVTRRDQNGRIVAFTITPVEN